MVRGPAVLGLSLLLSLSLSGCLADDIWREPFTWREVAAVGENVDAAQAFAGTFGELPGRAGDDVGEQVVGTADDLPDNVVFQNFKEFLDRQAPGRGEQAEDTVRIATDNASATYYSLAGQAAEAWEQSTGEISGTPGPTAFTLPPRTTRLRVTVDVALAQSADPPGTNPTPTGNVEVRLIDGRGAERLHYVLDATRHIEDMFIVGTYGGANEVREDLSGTWALDVSATGEGAWSVRAEAFEPRYDDYESWQVWRGERREVTG